MDKYLLKVINARTTLIRTWNRYFPHWDKITAVFYFIFGDLWNMITLRQLRTLGLFLGFFAAWQTLYLNFNTNKMSFSFDKTSTGKAFITCTFNSVTREKNVPKISTRSDLRCFSWKKKMNDNVKKIHNFRVLMYLLNSFLILSILQEEGVSSLTKPVLNNKITKQKN